MGEKLVFAKKELGWLPGFLLREPRGHKDLFGALLTAPCHPQADYGVIFMDNQTFEPMCGHAVIGTVTSLLETGMCTVQEPVTWVTLDTPAGPVKACAQIQGGQAGEIAYQGVPSFLYRKNIELQMPAGETLHIDVAFGGNFFALVEAGQTGLELVPANAGRLADLGMAILEATNRQVKVCHPEMPDIDRVIDLRFYQTLAGDPHASRNCVVLGDHMIDRSPCGTGTCAELALRFSRDELTIGQLFQCQSILGTRFKARVVTQTTVSGPEGSYPAVIVEVAGRAHITGLNQLLLETEDPFPEGFLL
jgi:proline racemase